MMNKTISCGFHDILGSNGVIKEIATYLDDTGITRLRPVCRELYTSITSDVFTNALQRRFGYLLASKPSALTTLVKGIPEDNPENRYKALASSTNTIIKQYDKRNVIANVKKNWRALEDASYRLRTDKEVVLFAVKQNGDALQYASNDLKTDKEVALAAVNQNWRSLQYASDDLKNNRAVVLAAVNQSGWALQYASADLRNDKAVVLAAVNQSGRALQYASDALRNNKEVVLAAVNQIGDAFKFASYELKNDPEFNRVIKAIRDNRPIIDDEKKE